MGEPTATGAAVASDPIVLHGLAGLQERAGQDIGTSSWWTVDQKKIDIFAALTGDEQWIHVDPARARGGPFGATVQHGFLTLGLATGLLWQVCTVEGFGVILNYGLNKVRFPAPLRVGSRIRMHVALAEVKALDGGAEAVYRLTYEIDGEPKPCCVADLVFRYYSRGRAMTTTDNPAIGQSVQANGIRTNYLESGSGDETVVLVHGSGPGVTSYANWRLVLPELGKDFHCVAPDMVGFGYSERPDDVEYSVQVWADQTLGVMDALGIQKAHMIGNSFGGAIALRIATQHPERVDKLVLMGSMGVDFEITEGLDAVWGYQGTYEDMRRVMGFFAYDTKLTTDELAKVRYEGATQPGFQESFSAMFPEPRQRWVQAMSSPEAEISALPHRTLILHGREDKVIPLANSYQLMELLDNADLAVFSHCGHWSMIERTADFNRLVRDFFLGD